MRLQLPVPGTPALVPACSGPEPLTTAGRREGVGGPLVATLGLRRAVSRTWAGGGWAEGTQRRGVHRPSRPLGSCGMGGLGEPRCHFRCPQSSRDQWTCRGRAGVSGCSRDLRFTQPCLCDGQTCRSAAQGCACCTAARATSLGPHPGEGDGWAGASQGGDMVSSAGSHRSHLQMAPALLQVWEQVDLPELVLAALCPPSGLG